MFRKVIPIIFLFVALAGGQEKPAAKPASSGNPALPSEATINAFMQQMFGYESAMSWKIVDVKPAQATGLGEVTLLFSGPQGQQSTTLYITPDGHHAVVGEVIPFGAKPFAEDREKLQKEVNGPSRGPANAPVTVVEFSDLQCPHCKDAQPNVDKLLADEPNVRFVFQNFPLPSHNWATKAARYADCVGRTSSDAFWKFVQGTFDDQANITESNADEKLTAIADKSGVKGADMAACSSKPETLGRVEHSLALGRGLGVNGTPTMFINGRKVSNMAGAPVDVLKALVEFHAKNP